MSQVLQHELSKTLQKKNQKLTTIFVIARVIMLFTLEYCSK